MMQLVQYVKAAAGQAQLQLAMMVATAGGMEGVCTFAALHTRGCESLRCTKPADHQEH